MARRVRIAALLAALSAMAFTPALAVTLRLAWDPNSETTLKGYKLYWGTQTRGCVADPLNETFIYWGAPAAQGASPITIFLDELADPANPTYVLVNLPDSVGFFSVTAIDTSGNESRYSDELQIRPQGPLLCDASANTDSAVDVTYNELIDQITSTDPANYDLRDSAGSPVGIATIGFDAVSFKRVTLVTAALAEGETYTLTVNNVRDFSDGDVIAPSSQVQFAFTYKPHIRRVEPLNHPEPRLQVEFSEDVSNPSASTASNYAIDNGIAVTFAQKAIDRNFSADNRSVSLDTTGLVEGTTYTLTVNNVEDMFGNAIMQNSTLSFLMPVDLKKPIALSAHVAAPLRKRGEVHVVFDEEVSSATAADPANYAINNGMSVSGATLFGDNKTVILETSAHPDGDYQITVSGVADASAAHHVVEPTILSYRVIDAITDSDGDGREDVRDNCTRTANVDQRDTDSDGFGNPCDGDFNEDAQVDSADSVIFRNALSTQSGDANFNANADLNGDGVVDSVDTAMFRNLLFKPPGPSGVAP